MTQQHSSVVTVCQALKDLADAVRSASSEKRTFNETFGWNSVALDRSDVAHIADKLSDRIKTAADCTEIDEEFAKFLTSVAEQVNRLKTTTIPQLFNGGNSYQAVSALLETLTGFWLMLSDFTAPKWERMEDPDLMPRSLAQRVRGIDAHLKQIEPDVVNLKETIELIRDARATAHSLPADLAMLKEANESVTEIKKAATADRLEIAAKWHTAGNDANAIRALVEDGERLITQLRALHRIGTSTTLAGAFDARAQALSKSVIGWAIVLVVALAAGVWIGSYRVMDINAAMAAPKVNWEGVWINVLLTAFSVSAPVWLGWVATKQIIQRFRLAEDYAYKASISNAYEGYRREAVELDASFREKLFGSALTRLDELPGRLVDQATHGSPIHEFLATPAVQEAIKSVPDFGKSVKELAESAVSSLRGRSKPKAVVVAAPAGTNPETKSGPAT